MKFKIDVYVRDTQKTLKKKTNQYLFKTQIALNKPNEISIIIIYVFKYNGLQSYIV